MISTGPRSLPKNSMTVTDSASLGRSDVLGSCSTSCPRGPVTRGSYTARSCRLKNKYSVSERASISQGIRITRSRRSARHQRHAAYAPNTVPIVPVTVAYQSVLEADPSMRVSVSASRAVAS